MRKNLIHKIVASFFILSIVFSMILPSVIFVNFKINQDFIAKNLCVDKEIEESTCQGTCQLKKELKKVEKKSDEPIQNKSIVESEITNLYLEEIKKFTIISANKINKSYFQSNSKPVSGFSQSLFRPPIS